MTDVVAAAEAAVRAYPGSTKMVAAMMGKNASTLASELLEASASKLGLRDAVKISQVTGDKAILNAFAQALNCAVIELDHPLSGADPMYLLSQFSISFARYVEVCADAASKARPSFNHLQALERRWLAHVALGQEIVTYLRAAYDHGKPESMKAPSL
jgi:hypothetical protein